jgi:hypothetical protein
MQMSQSLSQSVRRMEVSHSLQVPDLILFTKKLYSEDVCVVVSQSSVGHTGMEVSHVTHLLQLARCRCLRDNNIMPIHEVQWGSRFREFFIPLFLLSKRVLTADCIRTYYS